MSDIFLNDDDLFYDEYDQKQQSNEPIQQKKKQNLQEVISKNNQLSKSHKNKIINRIKQLAPETSLKQLSKKPQSQKSLDKRQLNKISAKQSRIRKKLYIQIMEEKQKKLQQELLNKKKQLQQTKNYMQKVIQQNQTMSSFTTGRHQMIKKLENLLERQDENVQSQINQILNNLRFRIGPTGKQRINTINQYFRQIVNLSLPALHRYMMWSASENKHLFGDDQDIWYQQLKNNLNLSEQQKQQIKLHKQKFVQQKQLLLKLIDNLKKVKDNIEVKSIQLEDLIDQIRQILNPVQSAQFVIFIQKNKYRKELNLCDIGNEDNVKKKIKLN